MVATKASPFTFEPESKRHRAAQGPARLPIADVPETDDAAIAAGMIDVLASALERIVDTTSDPEARAIAVEALIEFRGR